jgi:hypothetical protein
MKNSTTKIRILSARVIISSGVSRQPSPWSKVRKLLSLPTRFPIFSHIMLSPKIALPTPFRPQQRSTQQINTTTVAVADMIDIPSVNVIGV